MKSKVLLIVLIAALTSATAQINLVGNGGFEDISGKLKEGAKVDIATGWYSLTAVGADIFAAESKEPGMQTPDNAFGREKPYSGSNYAGFLAYSYQSKEPRSYLITELAQPLEAGKKYCVQFYVSLSDLSKFSSNNIGAHITGKEFSMSDSQEPLLVDAHIKHSKNKVIETTVFWEPICGVFTAKGGEKYLIIGNFYADNATSAKKMKKAPQFKQNQLNNAYYFVDDVSLSEMGAKESCSCEKEEFVDVPKVIYRKTESNVSNDDMAEELLGMKIQFDSLSSVLSEEALKDVNKLADFLKVKSSLTIVIIGHSSDKEADLAKKNQAYNLLSANRAKAVADVLIKAGINKTRFKVEGVKNTQPFVYGNRPEDHAANCAVHFEILTE